MSSDWAFVELAFAVLAMGFVLLSLQVGAVRKAGTERKASTERHADIERRAGTVHGRISSTGPADSLQHGKIRANLAPPLRTRAQSGNSGGTIREQRCADGGTHDRSGNL
ncbi:MAG: hypothetical protein ACI4B6_02455 [Atopobiaceae bacterium]